MAPKAEKKPAEKKPVEERKTVGDKTPTAVAEKKPKEKAPPKAGKKKISKEGGDKKKRKKRSVETYKIYIFKVLKQVHPDIGISSKRTAVNASNFQAVRSNPRFHYILSSSLHCSFYQLTCQVEISVNLLLVARELFVRSLRTLGMAEQVPEENVASRSIMDNITENFHAHHSSSSSDDDEKPSISSSINKLFGRQKSVHSLLGGGKVADLVLWRNKQMSASFLVGATVLWFLFEGMEYPLLTFVCHVLILSLVILFIWINSAAFLKRSPPHIPEVVISEDTTRRVASELRVEVNRAFSSLHGVASGKDLKKLLLVIAVLYLFSIVGNCCDFLTVVYIGLVTLLTVPVLYEKYEDQVDSLAHKVLFKIKEQYKVFDAKVLKKIPRGPLKEKKLS